MWSPWLARYVIAGHISTRRKARRPAFSQLPLIHSCSEVSGRDAPESFSFTPCFSWVVSRCFGFPSNRFNGLVGSREKTVETVR